MDDLPFRGQIPRRNLGSTSPTKSLVRSGERRPPFHPNDSPGSTRRTTRTWTAASPLADVGMGGLHGAHGVEAVVDRSRALGVDLAGLPGKVAAVGPAKKRPRRRAGLAVSLVRTDS